MSLSTTILPLEPPVALLNNNKKRRHHHQATSFNFFCNEPPLSDDGSDFASSDDNNSANASSNVKRMSSSSNNNSAAGNEKKKRAHSAPSSSASCVMEPKHDVQRQFCNFSWLLYSSSTTPSRPASNSSLAAFDDPLTRGVESEAGERRCILQEEAEDVDSRQQDDCDAAADQMYRRGSTRDLQRPVFIERMVDWLFQFADVYAHSVSLESVHLAARIIVRYLSTSEHSCGTCARWLPAACLLLSCKWLGWLNEAVEVGRMVGDFGDKAADKARAVRLVLALETRVATLLQFRVDEPTFYDMVQRLTFDAAALLLPLPLSENGANTIDIEAKKCREAEESSDSRYCAMLCALAAMDVRTGALFSQKEIGVSVVLLAEAASSSSSSSNNNAHHGPYHRPMTLSQLEMCGVDANKVRECSQSLLRFARALAGRSDRRHSLPPPSLPPAKATRASKTAEKAVTAQKAVTKTGCSSASKAATKVESSTSFFLTRWRSLLFEFLELTVATTVPHALL